MRSAFHPEILKDALSCRRDTHARPYAGGTDLMPQNRRWIGVRPGFDAPVMFIGHLAELQGIERRGEEIAIGACCTLARLAERDAVPSVFRRIMAAMASTGVRNLATIGGNICNASPAGDTLPYLYAVDARLVLNTADDRRELPISEFILGPGLTCLGQDEILTEIILPVTEWDVHDYHKVGARRANAPSKVSFLGLVRRNGRRFDDLRLAFGAVGPTVVRSVDMENDLLSTVNAAASGACGTADLIDRSMIYASIIRPIDDQRAPAAYRRRVALNLLRHFLMVLGGGPGRGSALC